MRQYLFLPMALRTNDRSNSPEPVIYFVVSCIVWIPVQHEFGLSGAAVHWPKRSLTRHFLAAFHRVRTFEPPTASLCQVPARLAGVNACIQGKKIIIQNLENDC